MVLFTLLGVIALVLRERKVNNNHSGRDEVDQNDGPPVRSSDVDDYWNNPLEKDVGGTLNITNDRSEDRPVDSSQTPGHVAPHCAADVPQASVCQTEDTVPSQSSQLQSNERKIIEINSCSYEISAELGKGSFGFVHAATRLEDGLQVAIKFSSNENTKFISIEGYSKPLPLEVALHILANQGPRVPEIIQLLDWQVEPEHYYMVLERPVPCQCLFDFVQSYKGVMEEDVIRIIMRQVVSAAQICCQRGVLHRDIKLENLVINPDTLEVKLIDFGCGDILTSTSYTYYFGSKLYCPPEFLMTGMYHGEAATVWSLGILMFLIIFNKFPTKQDLCKLNDKPLKIKGLSGECYDFMRSCLQINPNHRIELEKLSLHNWFKVFYEDFHIRFLMPPFMF